MSKIIGDSACPKCRENGRDSTGNHLIHFEDGGRHCNRCGYTVAPDGQATEDYEDNMKWNQYTVADVLKLPIGADPARKVSNDTANHFRTRVEYNTSTGEVDKVFYPYIKNGKAVGYKVRKHYEEGDRELERSPELLGKFKCFRAIGDVTGVLYNQHQAGQGGKRLLIVEGEEDAHAAYEMLAKYNPKVVSIPSGATVNKEGKGVLDKGILENLDFINSYEEVITCFDNDDSGKAITEALASLVGDKVKVLKLSEKDASDMLTKEKQTEFVNAYFSAKEYAPAGFVSIDDVYEDVIKMPVWGRLWPWPSLNKLTYGRRDGEGMYVGAGVKVGKSEFINQFIEFTSNAGELNAIFKFEELPSMTYRKVAGKLKHKQFHIPDGDFSQEELIEAANSLREMGLFVYGKYGTNSWNDIEPNIRWAASQAKREGKKLNIIVDPLTRLVSADPSEANKQLIEISDKLSTLAKDLEFFYIVCTHLNAPTSGKPHEEGGRVHSNQFTGSRAMMRACYYMVGIERDKTAEDETERNTSQFVLLEDRAFGNSGRFDVFYDRDTGDYLEPETTRF